MLVRNLYSSTLDLLGTGATFAQGDLTNYRSIVDAVSGVDKVSTLLLFLLLLMLTNFL